jgi:hypothetical protein
MFIVGLAFCTEQTEIGSKSECAGQASSISVEVEDDFFPAKMGMLEEGILLHSLP